MILKFDRSIIIQRPITEVFNYAVNLENQPKWHHWIVNTDRLTEGNIGIGTRWKEHFQFLGLHANTILEITDYKPYQSVTFNGTFVGPLCPNFTITFDKVEVGTRMTYRVHPEMVGVMGWILGRSSASTFGKRDLTKYLNRLKLTLETAIV